jgi:disulfide bond formation protein DsbB
MSPSFAVRLNALALYAIGLVLLAAFYFQITLGELPCPLCLLQRAAFTALAVGPVLTLRLGPRPSHYGITVLAAFLGAGIAARQVLLHIAPGDPGYGSALFGYHFYTWAFVCFAAAILASAVMFLADDAQFSGPHEPPQLRRFEAAAIWLVIVLTLLNAGSALLQCGFAACPADPVHYELLGRIV